MTPEKALNPKTLFEVKEVKDTLFTLVKKENEPVMIVIGDTVATAKTFESYEDAEEYINSKPYDLINISCYMFSNHVTRMQNLQADKTQGNGDQDKN